MPDLSVYSNRNAFAYFGLSAPALLLQGLFLVTLAASATFPVPGNLPFVALAVQLVPWAVLAASFFAVATFRSSLLLSLLVLSYFVVAVLSGGASFAIGGYLFGSGETAALVVAASFCSLIGFGYSRAARIEKGRRTTVSSGGSLPFQTVGVFLEFFFPALAAIGLVVATVLVVGGLRAETMQFPPPLSGIFSNFVVSPIVTIVVAAITLTVVKDVVEPWILYYTITKEDATKIMETEAKKMEARVGVLARLGTGGLLFSSLVILVLLGIIVLIFGLPSLLSNLGPVFGIGKPNLDPSSMIRFDNAYNEFLNLLNQAIHLLWG